MTRLVGHGKHAPIRLTKYLEIHEKAIRDLQGRGFLLDADLEISAQGNDFLTMGGTLYCAGNQIKVQILKQICLSGDEPLAQTGQYAYTAVLSGIGNIIRYDSPHMDHNRFHHAHKYDVLNGDKEGTIDELSEDQRPTLAQMVDDLESWYYDNYEGIQEILKLGESR